MVVKNSAAERCTENSLIEDIIKQSKDIVKLNELGFKMNNNISELE